MSQSFKGKGHNIIPQINMKQAKNEKINIPHPKTNKLKIYKSGRPFGKDVTNTFKQNYPIMGMSNFVNPSNVMKKVRKYFI